MTERDLTPSDEAEVSRLLADAATSAPLPADVAARLDDVLAGLVAQRREDEQEQTPQVVHLARRRWPKVLLAAAAVSLLGYGGSALIDAQRGADSPASAGGDGDSSRPELTADDQGASGGEEPEAGLPEDPLAAPLPTADVDARAVADSVIRQRLGAVDYASGTDVPPSGCATPRLDGDASAFSVSSKAEGDYVVVVRPAGGRAALAEVYPCRVGLFPIATEVVLAAR